ncbi:MAG: glycogen operon protein GlgX homolog [Alphaproteobacteria bacterium]|nr:MAG: glycogen operon protein GlgX homolog [Alphaproteobacteria bacterium]
MEGGATPTPRGTRFRVRSLTAERLWLCLFDEADREARWQMDAVGEGWFEAFVAGAGVGTRYGLRAEGRYAPAEGCWFDPAKLLVDPCAVAIDRPYAYDPRLGEYGFDTARLVPKAVVTRLPEPLWPPPPRLRPGGLIYEIAAKAFTRLHPDVPAARRGTIAALAEPAVLDHLTMLGVNAVELMPITATIDERHLPALGLANAWGYNPVTFMALDPRLAPGGIDELRAATASLRTAGIGVILDLVFNHTGESDALGLTLSLRGLDNRTWYRHDAEDRLVNHTGCGNTIACDREPVIEHIVGCLRHFVLRAGVDGFRFDLATVLGRGEEGFDTDAPLLRAIGDDPVLSDRVMIAEPWDVGPNGYRLGAFPDGFLEWNDRYRDDVRRFWRGEATCGELATRLAGSSDIFGRSGARATRSVNFVAAHDGFTLRDTVSFARKHNAANGESNRDGHDHNFSWNCGVEGETDDPAVKAARRADIKALLATLFVSRGTIMLTAGDEFGRTQRGNNNAYAQDNVITWLDWRGRDREIEAFAGELARLRARSAVLRDAEFLTGQGDPPDVAWLRPDGAPMAVADWEDTGRHAFAMVLRAGGAGLIVMFNRGREPVAFVLPDGRSITAAPRSVGWRQVNA